jgi:hypothetical protein
MRFVPVEFGPRHTTSVVVSKSVENGSAVQHRTNTAAQAMMRVDVRTGQARRMNSTFFIFARTLVNAMAVWYATGRNPRTQEEIGMITPHAERTNA